MPDSPLVTARYPSANAETRRNGFQPKILLLHYTGMTSMDTALVRLASPEAKVSCHYVVGLAGEIIQMVPEALRAWHAGVAQWRGFSDINSSSIGVEIHNPGHDGGYPDYPATQIAAVKKLCADLVTRHAIRADHVLGHSDVAPRRKIDPGEKFPWMELAEDGIGHWVTPIRILNSPSLGLGTADNAVMRLQRQLRAYGYWIEATGTFDEHTAFVVTAFQRHFRPALVDGRADASTVETLDRLLARMPCD